LQFTYVCPTEIISFSENADVFAGMNTQVIGVSTDSHHTHLAWIKTPREEGGLGNVNIVSRTVDCECKAMNHSFSAQPYFLTPDSRHVLTIMVHSFFIKTKQNKTK